MVKGRELGAVGEWGGENALGRPLWNLLSLLPLEKSLYSFLKNLLSQKKCFSKYFEQSNKRKLENIVTPYQTHPKS